MGLRQAQAERDLEPFTGHPLTLSLSKRPRSLSDLAHFSDDLLGGIAQIARRNNRQA